MSTKIYYAYKLLNRHDLWSFSRDVKVKASKNVEKVLYDFYKNLISSIDETSEKYKEKYNELSTNKYLPKENDEEYLKEYTKLEIVDSIVRDEYKKSSVSMQRDLFDFDVNIAFYENKKKIYMRYFCDMQMKNVFDFLEDDIRVIDFHYQNQSDQPEHISNRDWNNRRKVWDEIFSEPGYESTYLTLEIFNYNMFWKLNPYNDILKEIYKRKKEICKEKI